jgi:hypothetical protein
MLVTCVVVGVIGLGGRIVWGFVILRLAELGIKHPAHKGFLVELARLKKVEMPSLTVGKISKNERKSSDDIADK